MVPADEQVAQSLDLELGASVIVLERLRFVDEEPWVLVTTYLPFEIAPGLLTDDLENQSLYGLLEQKYGVQLRYGQRAIEASIAGAALARSLGISPGDPVLVLRSTVYGNQRPVEMFVAYHRGDRSRFEVSLNRSTAAILEREPLMRVTM